MRFISRWHTGRFLSANTVGLCRPTFVGRVMLYFSRPIVGRYWECSALIGQVLCWFCRPIKVGQCVIKNWPNFLSADIKSTEKLSGDFAGQFISADINRQMRQRLKLLSQFPDTNCDLDHIPTSLLKQSFHILLPTITNIMNLSITTGISSDQFKYCSVHPHLDTLTLIGIDDLDNCLIPIKLTEWVVKLRLVHYLSPTTSSILSSLPISKILLMKLLFPFLVMSSHHKQTS